MNRYSSINEDFKKNDFAITDVFLQINKMIDIDKNIIISFCEKYCRYYTFIEHKGDLNEEGIVEYTHYHLVLTFLSPKRFTTVLNQVCKYFVNFYPEFCNDNGIKADAIIDYRKSLRYLLHLDNPEKTRHNFDELISNMTDIELHSYIDDLLTKPKSLTVDYIVNLSYRFDESNYDEFIKEIGFARYERSRNVIRDIYKAIRFKVEKEKIKRLS